jgi:hypothetical protein
MLEKQYYYLDHAAKFLTERTEYPITQDDLIDQALQGKLLLSISVSNWLIKEHYKEEPFLFDGYGELEKSMLKSAIQTFRRGEKYFAGAILVKTAELAQYHVFNEGCDYTVLYEANSTSCPLALTDIVVRSDRLLDFFELHCMPKPTKSIKEKNERSSSANLFRRNKTGTWDFKFNHLTYPPMPHRKGFAHIQHLLQNPNKAIKSVELISLVSVSNVCHEQDDVGDLLDNGLRIVESSNLGQVIDNHAARQYEERMVALKDLIKDATEDGDTEAKEVYKEELDFLFSEFKKHIDSKGRPKKIKTDARKISQAIAKNVRNAIKDMSLQCPELANHLDIAIKTGAVCEYRPSIAIEWGFY